ncbi:hypothetical protein KIPB_002556 [Kipferlia bialata]|uniref:Uncharacterized protein n=1 Tax=Kipferlia bialata TaxID=797122 RepID=A0A9K3CSF4_9EUKA|nr:hypothetical protein KIPB_002556 [Kipferlia bialata]|eukprot:g2556.t1
METPLPIYLGSLFLFLILPPLVHRLVGAISDRKRRQRVERLTGHKAEADTTGEDGGEGEWDEGDGRPPLPPRPFPLAFDMALAKAGTVTPYTPVPQGPLLSAALSQCLTLLSDIDTATLGEADGTSSAPCPPFTLKEVFPDSDDPRGDLALSLVPVSVGALCQTVSVLASLSSSLVTHITAKASERVSVEHEMDTLRQTAERERDSETERSLREACRALALALSGVASQRAYVTKAVAAELLSGASIDTPIGTPSTAQRDKGERVGERVGGTPKGGMGGSYSATHQMKRERGRFPSVPGSPSTAGSNKGVGGESGMAAALQRLGESERLMTATARLVAKARDEFFTGEWDGTYTQGARAEVERALGIDIGEAEAEAEAEEEREGRLGTPRERQRVGGR